MGCNKNECILQLGSDQFVVTKEAALRAFGSKIEAFLDTSSEPDMFTKYIIRRPRASTLALIEYCYTGQLHIPQSVCKGEFLTELQFWGLRYKLLETCCYQKLCIFLNNQKMLKGFQEMYTRQENSSTDRKQYRSVKERIWGIVNSDRKSRLSKVYFRVSTTFVLLMIVVLAITSMNDVSESTQRNISTQLEDMNSTITSDSLRSISSTVDEDNSKTPSFIDNETQIKVIYPSITFRVSCEFCSTFARRSPELSPTDENIGYRVEHTDIYLHIPKCCQLRLSTPITITEIGVPLTEEPDYSDTYPLNTSKTYVNADAINHTNKLNLTQLNPGTVQLLNHSFSKNDTIIFKNDNFTNNFKAEESKVQNIVTGILTTVLNSKEKLSSFSSILKLSDSSDLEMILCHYIERVITTFFTIEFVLRLISCPNKKDFFCGALNWLDFILLLGSFSRILLELRNDATATMTLIYDLLLYLQMFRVLRLFRTIEHVKAFKVLRYSLATGMKDIYVLDMYVIVSMCIFANFIFFVENRSDFPSLPAAWWFSIVTMTSVGYGDMVPQTALGKLIGCLCALTGVVLFSLIIPVFVNTFLTTYEYSDGSQDGEAGESNSQTGKHKATLSAAKTASLNHKERGERRHLYYVEVQCPKKYTKGNLQQKSSDGKMLITQI